MKLRDQARGRTIPPARSTGPPSTGYKPEEDYLGDEAQLLYLEREKNPQPFGDRPLFVLAAGKRPPPPGMTEDSYKDIRHAIDQDRAEAAHLSRNSKFVLDVKSGHDIQIDDPKAVAEAVEEVVAAVKNQTKLADITVPSAGLAANVTSIFTAPVAAQVLVQSAGPFNITNITVDGTGGDQGCTPSNIWLAGIFYSSSSGEVNRVVVSGQRADGCGVGVWAENGNSSNQSAIIQASSIHDMDPLAFSRAQNPS